MQGVQSNKLLYPLLAMRRKVPRYIPIVPVYLRAVRGADGLRFYVAECEYRGSLDNITVDRLHVKSRAAYILGWDRDKIIK
jgi:hypothetical protein